MSAISLAGPRYTYGEAVPPEVFADSLSADVLSLSPKPYIDLGSFVVNTAPRARSSEAKLSGSTEVSSAAISNNRKDEIILNAHSIVLDALSKYLDEDLFVRSSVQFDHRNWPVEEGATQATYSEAWHVDGVHQKGLVRAMVLFFDRLPTSMLHNSIRPTDLDATGRLISIQGAPIAETSIIDEELPINHLLLLPNIPHRAKIAMHRTPRRFMRWSVLDA